MDSHTRTALLAAIGLCLGACTGVKILQPTGDLRDPLPAFTVQFHPNYVGPFTATLDPDTPGPQDWTARFSPAPQAGMQSSASVEEPLVGGTLILAGTITLPGQTVTNYGRYRHTFKVVGEVRQPASIGFSLEEQRDRVDFVPLHAVLSPPMMRFQQGSTFQANLCLVPTPTRTVEVLVALEPDAQALTLRSGSNRGPGVVVPVSPSADVRHSCVVVEISEQRPATPGRTFGVTARCNGCQLGSAGIEVQRRPP